MRDGPSSSSTNNASDPRAPASVPATSCPATFHAGLKLHVLVEEEGVAALPGMGIDFISEFFQKHLVACACGTVSFITQVMGLACGID
ncbi:hypothetical protein [Bacillus sp. KH172YL63]|uniref:hypothetical protein n=1 Tax=Bacillus sp. KH172YL63 TaxID=2709784 RepID=UPI0013E44830|nr:hypothetical protein KH172YL63_05380 [Bacillus sp. KH172YL63]